MLEINGTLMFTELAEIVEPRHTALIIVDVQRDFCTDDGVAGRLGRDLSIIKPAIGRIKDVLAAARRAGVMPIYIQNLWLPDNRSNSGSWLRFSIKTSSVDPKQGWTIVGSRGAEIVPEIAPRPGDIVVPKCRSTAFFGTNLDTILRCNGIKSVICVGFVTEGCLESTARDAMFHDYYTVVLEDCVGTFEQKLHDAALTVLRVRVDVVPSAEVLAIWSRAAAAGGRAKLRTA